MNTEGSFYCSCPHPLVLDDTQRTCVNATDHSPDEHVSLCWQSVSADLLCQSLLLGAQLSFTDCCCLYGQGWGLECALCPQPDTEDYASLCSSVHSPFYPDTFPDSGTSSRPGSRPGPARGGAPVPFFPPFTSELYPPLDYDDSAPAGGAAGPFDHGYREPPYGGVYFPEPDYDPDQTRPGFGPGPRFSPDPGFTPDGSRFSPETRFSPDSGPFLVPPDPRSEQAFQVQQPPASDPSLYSEGEEPEWRGFPPVSRPAPRRLYDRRFEAAAEDCGIVNGCVNGRCIRVAEGYTCDCYHGYELDLTLMTCIDINECDGGVRLEFPCVNARCVNTEGSYRCVCRRGYVLSRRPHYCVAA